MKKEQEKTRRKFRSIALGVVVALFAFQAFEFIGGPDYVKSWFYEPSEEMSGIISELELTGRGERILRAVSPTLEDRETFNKNCESHNSEIYVLGCFLTAKDHIYLYNVEEKDLDGVKESTTAHELLHAVYHRLLFWEKDSLNKELKAFYESLDEDSEIRSSMKLYNEKDLLDELHSRFGTEIKDLPEKLEKHYEAIFKNQDKIVDFYDKYSGKFKELNKEIEELEKKMKSLESFINEETTQLEKLVKNLNSKIETHNKNVRTKNYDSVSLIEAEGKVLQKQYDDLKKRYNELDKVVNDYNKLVKEYNSNVIHTNKLMESINSNSNKMESVE